VAARKDWPLEDRWIVSRTLATAAEVNKLLGDFQLNEAGRVLYDFLWSEYCDWYLEMAKVRLKDGDSSPLPVLAYVLQASLRLLHPIMPFVSEYIWQHLRDHVDGLEEALIIAAYPLGGGEPDADAEERVGLAIDVAREIRDLRTTAGIDPKRIVSAVLIPSPPDGSPIVTSLGLDRLQDLRSYLANLLERIGDLSRTKLEIGSAGSHTDAIHRIVRSIRIAIPRIGLLDLAAERERTTKERQEAQSQVDRLSRKLGNTEFRSKAPADVVARQEQMLASAKSTLSALEQRLAELG
jgi:valyl-tRNA synthetase